MHADTGPLGKPSLIEQSNFTQRSRFSLLIAVWKHFLSVVSDSPRTRWRSNAYVLNTFAQIFLLPPRFLERLILVLYTMWVDNCGSDRKSRRKGRAWTGCRVLPECEAVSVLSGLFPAPLKISFCFWAFVTIRHFTPFIRAPQHVDYAYRIENRFCYFLGFQFYHIIANPATESENERKIGREKA